MTRLIVVVVLLVLMYWLVRNIIRGFLRGLNLGNGNRDGGDGSRRPQKYKDVQDAEFKDITDDT